jgi:hypothetical protein
METSNMEHMKHINIQFLFLTIPTEQPAHPGLLHRSKRTLSSKLNPAADIPQSGSIAALFVGVRGKREDCACVSH